LGVNIQDLDYDIARIRLTIAVHLNDAVEHRAASHAFHHNQDGVLDIHIHKRHAVRVLGPAVSGVGFRVRV
jgi:hypothetical protein